MDFISNFNGLEIVFILILGLIIFGPERLPAIGFKVGGYMRKLRQVSTQIIDQWKREAGLEEVTANSAKLTASLKNTANNINTTVQPIGKTISEVVKPNLKTVGATALGVKSGHGSEPQSETKKGSEPSQEQGVVQRIQDLEKQINALKQELGQLDIEEDE